MYGTIMRARVKKGHLEELERLFEDQRAVVERAPGFHSTEFAQEDRDPDRVIAVIHFKDKASYVANASRPETDVNYRRMLEHMEGEPEWTDVHYRRYFGEPVSGEALAGSGTR